METTLRVILKKNPAVLDGELCRVRASHFTASFANEGQF
jgi:hypothetical protein